MQEVLVLDPDLSKNYLDRIQNRTKERRYSFDHAFGPNSYNWVCLHFFSVFGEGFCIHFQINSLLPYC